MRRVKPGAHLGNSTKDSHTKLQSANDSMQFAKKMVAVVENKELRERLKTLTSNQATTSTFIFGIAVACVWKTGSMTPGVDDPEYDAKMVVKSLFFCLSAVSALLLLLAVGILKIQLTLFVLTPDHCVDDLLLKLWLTWLPEVLITVAALLLSALLSLYAFFHFGTGLEFYLVLAITILCVITSFVYWMLAKRLLHDLYKHCLDKQSVHIESGYRGVYQGSTKYCTHRKPSHIADSPVGLNSLNGGGGGSEPTIDADAGHAPG
tara:strand:- start:105 stop:893 length:789 start_codon:yes stop_codon:yes gene_type:complete